MEILFTSEAYVKSHTTISENLEGHFLSTAIAVAQSEYVEPILGDCLTAKIKNLLANDEIDEEDNIIYKQCLDYIQPFLAFQTVGEVAVSTSNKISNMGVHHTNTENGSYAGNSTMLETRRYWLEKANHYALKLKRWLKDNKESIPEYDCKCSDRIIKLPNVQICL